MTYLSTKEKTWYVIGPTILSFAFALTTPTIYVYFISLIEPKILALANIIGTALSAIVNYSIPKEHMKEWYRKHFLSIILIDILCFHLITFFGYEYPEIRFIGFAIINAVSTCLWVMIMRNTANRIITDGDARTDFDALNRYLTLTACLIGAVLAFIITLPVETCLVIQCIANAFMGFADWKAFRLLKRAYE